MRRRVLGASTWILCLLLSETYSRAELKLEQIIVEARQATAPDDRSWQPLKDKRASDERPESASCSVHLQHDVSVEEFVGGNVKAIRVARFRSNYNLPNANVRKVRQEVRKVWLGQFRYASCVLGWSEMTPWNIEASVEFEDGKRGALLTDGNHVQVRDRKGKYWFIRLRPAVD